MSRILFKHEPKNASGKRPKGVTVAAVAVADVVAAAVVVVDEEVEWWFFGMT